MYRKSYIKYTDGTIAYVNYVSGTDFNVKKVITDGSKVVKEITWVYGNNTPTTVLYLYVSKDINSLYEPYTESTQYLPNVGELRSLPNREISEWWEEG